MRSSRTPILQTQRGGRPGSFARAGWITLLCLAACSTATEPEEELRLVEPTTPLASSPLPAPAMPAQAIIERTLDPTLPGYLDEHAAEIAEHPLVVMPLKMLCSEVGPNIAGTIKRLNPDIVILADWEVLSRPNVWGEPSHRERFPLSAEVYDILSGHLARTTTGDVPYMWDGAPMINPWRDGRVNERLQEAVLERIVYWSERYPGTFDGFFHDYMSPNPWIYPSPDVAGIGDVDLDGDGIGTRDDEDEREVWVQWQRRLLDRLQTIYGPGLIQIANGRLPLDDPETAVRLAGIWYQHYPNLVWGLTDLEGLEMGLAHHDGSYLTPRRGRTWSIFSAEAAGLDGNIDFRRHASFLTEQFYVYSKSQAGDFAGRDPYRVELGAVSGPTVRTEGDGGEIVYSREFADGTVRIVFEPWGATRSLEMDVYAR